MLTFAKQFHSFPGTFENPEIKGFAEKTQAEKHEAALAEIRLLANFLDNRFVIPGTSFRLGWDAVIGLIPGIGDVITTAIAGYLVYRARELGVPKRVLARMIFNVTVDFAGGAVPLVGDIFDVAFKANMKNLRLLERHLQKCQSQTTKSPTSR